ncbi:MAG: hypothetical protein K6G45_07080 [Lachnospiraceae bacterium]|nr:hypothetical protein [Lachnospiraceae bacterium]
MIRFNRINIRKSAVVLSICVLSLLLCACGGQSERNAEIPTKEEAADYAENELGIKGSFSE